MIIPYTQAADGHASQTYQEAQSSSRTLLRRSQKYRGLSDAVAGAVGHGPGSDRAGGFENDQAHLRWSRCHRSHSHADRPLGSLRA